MILNDGIEKTYTLDDLIIMGRNKDMTYNNFSLFEKINTGVMPVYNLFDDYVPDLRRICRTYKLNATEQAKYFYKPKLLAYDIYGSVDLFFTIILLNNMTNAKEFNRDKIKLLPPDELASALNAIYNSDSELILSNRIKKGM